MTVVSAIFLAFFYISALSANHSHDKRWTEGERRVYYQWNQGNKDTLNRFRSELITSSFVMLMAHRSTLHHTVCAERSIWMRETVSPSPPLDKATNSLKRFFRRCRPQQQSCMGLFCDNVPVLCLLCVWLVKEIQHVWSTIRPLLSRSPRWGGFSDRPHDSEVEVRLSEHSDGLAPEGFIITGLSLNSFPPLMRPAITGKTWYF